MKTIYIKLLFLMLFIPNGVLAQVTLGGAVVDSKSNLPIPGVNVIVEGSATGTQTDFDGKFKLPKVIKGNKIVFTFIGYTNQTIIFNNQQALNVSLVEEANELKEVVIQVGYGSTRKKDATGALTQLTAKDFNKGAMVSADQLLAGKVAGVRITNDGGQPDAAPNIRIRGGASLSASNNPLIIIDGVPIGDSNPAGVSNPFTLVNPNDVESFSILKDASATAIYGVRASNGVIIITTKKGTSGAPQYNYSSNVSVGMVDKEINVMNGAEFAKFVQEYHPDRAENLGIQDPAFPTDPTKRILFDTNWQDEIFRTSISTDNSFSARANLYKKIPFRASIGMTTVQGLVKTSDYKRLSYSFKMTPKLLKDNLKIDINAKGTYSDKNAIDESGALGGAVAMDPTKPIFGSSLNNKFGGYFQATELKSIADDPLQRANIIGATNPLALLNQRSRPERALRFLGNVEFDYKIPFLKELRAIVNVGLDASESKIQEVFADNALATYKFNKETNPSTNYVFNPGMNFLENQTSTNQTMDAYLTYAKSLTGFVTRVDAQAGYAYQNFTTDGNKQNFQYNLTTGLRESNIDKANPANRYYNPLNLQAFFGRGNVDLLGKYLFTATFRADASSLFQKETRWGYFPAVGAAWKIKEETFIKDSKFVQDLKLRLGWGKTGQANIANVDGIGFFPSRPLFVTGNSNSQYLSGVNSYTARAFAPGITWEKTSTYNVGIDFELFKNSILSGSIDAYQRKTNDLLAKVPIPPGQGLADTFIQNVGSMDNKGLELSLNAKIIQMDNFTFTLGGNVAYNIGKVTDLKGISEVQASESNLPFGTGVILAYHAVGQQPYSAWVFQQVYDGEGRPIVGAYADLNEDGVITNSDRYYKALRPNWTFGFNTTFTYKNWDFTANFRGQLGGQVYNSRVLSTGFTERVIQGTSLVALNNVLNFYDGTPAPLFKDFNNNAVFSDYLLEDATFLRCDNITIAYKFAKFIKTSSLRVSGSVNNAFLITNYTGQDPENFNAVDNNFYPRPRTITFGLSLDF